MPPSGPAAGASSEGGTPSDRQYTVVEQPDGKRDVFMSTPDGDMQVGTASVPDADKILHEAGKYDESTGTWTVPEPIAKSLVSGRLGLLDSWMAQFHGGEASVVRGLAGAKALRGEMPDEEAMARGDEQLVKEQLAAAPQMAWSGGYGEMLGKATGVLANMAPFALEVGEHAVKEGAILGAGAAAIAVAALGTDGAGAPAAAAAVSGMMKAGVAHGTFSATMDVMAGNTYLDMLKRGVDPKMARTAALASGALQGALMVGQFKFLAAPLQRVFAEKVLASGAVKAAMNSWVANYAKETGASVALVEAQKAVEMATDNLTAIVAAKPEMLHQHPLNELADTLVTMGPAMALSHMPGAAAEAIAGTMRPETPAEQVKAGKLDEQLAERKTELEKEQVPVVAPVEEGKMQAGEGKIEGQKQDQSPDLEAQMQELIGQADKGDEEAAGKLLDKADEVLKAREEKPSLEQKTRDVETKARTNALQSDLQETRTLINELTAVRERMRDNGMPTRLLDTKLSKLLDEESGIREDLKFYSQEGQDIAVGKTETLEMRPTTLANAVAEGFKEGGRQSQTRQKELLQIAKDNGLSAVDVKRLIGNRSIGGMGDVEYRNFLEGFDRQVGGKTEHTEGFKEGVAKAVERKQALEELKGVQKDRQIRNERYVRELHGFPPIRKMETKDIKAYADILRQYDKGDEALSPKRVKALETTPLKGATTSMQALRKQAELTGRPLTDFQVAKVSPADIAKYDVPLSKVDAARESLVEGVKVAQAKGDALYHAFEKQLNALAADAISSRRKTMGLKERLADMLAPQQRALMDYIEDRDVFKTAEGLTPEEQKLAEFLREFHEGVFDYLVKTGELSGDNRFAGHYLFHTARPLSEMLRDIPDKGVKATAREFLNKWISSGEQLQPGPRPATALGLRKFLRQTLFRTGELTPSANVPLAAKRYARDFYRKVALDEAVPYLETLVRATRVLDKSPEAEELNNKLLEFTQRYLQAKKGNARQAVFGGGMTGEAVAMTEPVIRFGMSAMNLKYLAFNAALQAMQPLREGAENYMVLGEKGLAVAQARRFSAAGERLIENYKEFTGKSPWEQMKEPGRNVEENVRAVMYGMFQWTHQKMMENVLLGLATPEELKSGKIAPERLAEMKLAAGRWHNVEGNKSILGSTVYGAEWTQFKSWAIPALNSLKEDADELAKFAKTFGKEKPSAQALTETYRFAMAMGGAFLFRSWATKEMEDDTFLGRAIHYARRDIISMLQSIDPATWASGGVLAGWLVDTAKALEQLATLEQYKTRDGFKGMDSMKKQVTPNFIKQLEGPGNE